MGRLTGLRPYLGEVGSLFMVLALVSFVLWMRYQGASSDAPSAPAQARHVTVIADGLQTIPRDPIQSLEANNLPSTIPANYWPSDWPTERERIIPCSSDGDGVAVAAYRSKDSFLIRIQNVTEDPCSVTIQVRLPSGRYWVERLVVSGDAPVYQTLQGVRAADGNPVQKSGSVAPGSEVYYRFSNPAAEATRLYRRVLDDLTRLKQSHRTLYQRMANTLAECSWQLSQANAVAARREPGPLISHVHRALLSVRHAQALCTNAAELGRIPAHLAEPVRSGLDGLEQALTRSSMAALVLVPAATKTACPNGEPSTFIVRVTLRNSGAVTVEGVRLWVAGSESVRVVPSDAAVFGTLRPGQSVSAEFRVTLLEGASEEPITAHAGYVMSKSPAHLTLNVL